MRPTPDNPYSPLSLTDLYAKGLLKADITGDVAPPEGQDQLQEPNPLIDPINYINPGMITAPLRVGVGMASKAAPYALDAAAATKWMGKQLLADEAGSIKPGYNFLKQSKGINPFSYNDPTEYGKALTQAIGRPAPKTIYEKLRLMGAHDLDKYGTTDLVKLNAAKAEDLGIKRPILLATPPISGLARANKKVIKMDLAGIDAASPYEKELLRSGVLNHEYRHVQNSAEGDRPLFGTSPEHRDLGFEYSKTNDKILDRMWHPDKKKAVYNHIIDTQTGMPEYSKDLEKLINQRELYKSVFSPQAMKNAVAERALIGENYRASVGNRGFAGKDPYFADIMESGGHFAGPYKNFGHLSLPPYDMVRSEILAGRDPKIPLRWYTHLDSGGGLKKEMGKYRSQAWRRIKPSESDIAEIASPKVEVKDTPWKRAMVPAFIGGGIGTGALGAGYYYGSKE